MKIYISMLRGINMGGHKKIRMEELRGLYETLDFGNVRSYIQSGNVIFESPESDASALVEKLEVTWFMHAYQWFWIRGSYLLTATDILQRQTSRSSGRENRLRGGRPG